MNKKPNIIFILSDDLSYADVGAYGQRHIKTPNIDTLAQNGLRFTDAYSASPICGPSRCGLCTGLHMGHARIREHGQPVSDGAYQEILRPTDITFGEIMKSAGYSTAEIGKWAIGLGNTDAIPNLHGFDYSFGFYDRVYAHTFYPEYVWENGEPYFIRENEGFDMAKRYRRNFSRWDKSNPADENRYDEKGRLILDELSDPLGGRNTYDLCEEKALNFIENHADSPFFLYFCPQNPHGPLIVPSLGGYMNDDAFPSLRHKEWAAIITRLDDGIGKMMKLCRDKGIFDDTVFIFASDNGYSAWGYFGIQADGEVEFFKHKGPFRGQKFSLDGEGGMRVPLIFSWNGHIRRGVSSEPCVLYDLPATFAALGEAKMPKTDGISLLPILNDGVKMPERAIYWEYYHAQRVRIGDFVCFRPHPSSPIEVYNVVADSFERENIAASNPKLVHRARELFTSEHDFTDVFINPGESDDEHSARLKKLGLCSNTIAADSPLRRTIRF